MSERVERVLYDVDNTLYCNGHKTVHEMARRAVNALGEKGMPATARSIPLMESLGKHGVDVQGTGVLDSGATIYDFKDKEIIEKQWLVPNQVTEVLLKVSKYCDPNNDSISVATVKERVKFKPDDLHSRFRYDKDSPTVFGIYDLEHRLRIEEALRTIEGIGVRFMRYDNSTTQGCFQVTVEGIDKGTGTLRAATLLGLESVRLAAIGDDSAGDEALFKAVKAINKQNTTIAMGNGDPKLLKMADIKVPGIDQTPDGFTVAMRQLSLIN